MKIVPPKAQIKIKFIFEVVSNGLTSPQVELESLGSPWNKNSTIYNPFCAYNLRQQQLSDLFFYSSINNFNCNHGQDSYRQENFFHPKRLHQLLPRAKAALLKNHLPRRTRSVCIVVTVCAFLSMLMIFFSKIFICYNISASFRLHHSQIYGWIFAIVFHRTGKLHPNKLPHL